MNTYLSSENDGTLIISNKIDAPRQGTLVTVIDEEYIVSKGIIRPQLYDPMTGVIEPEARCSEASFGKEAQPFGKFYSLNALADQVCRFSLQGVYFGLKDPSSFIREDTKRFENSTVLDFTREENARKIKAGVSPSLLLDQLAVWDIFRRFHVTGVRSTAYASELVPKDMDPTFLKLSVNQQLERALEDNEEHHVSYFKLLEGTAKKLCKQLKCKKKDLIGKVFVLHRDPALPDASTTFYSVCAGVLRWSNECKSNEGVVFHPLDPYWKAAGGDFDGDSVVVLNPTKNLELHTPLYRVDYKKSSRQYKKDDILSHVLEDNENQISQLLGPLVLAITRLIERGEAPNDVRSLAAGVCQGSVQAQKHTVDIDSVQIQSNYLFGLVREASLDGAKPFITDYINSLRRAEGVGDKLIVWKALLSMIQRGAWKDGSDIEQALCERVLVLNRLFEDINFFQQLDRPKLPTFITDAAKSLASDEAKQAVKFLTEKYVEAVRLMPTDSDHELLDEEEKKAVTIYARDLIQTLNLKFRLAAVSGQIEGFKTTLEDAHYALVAHAPARIAARNVPPEIFETLGTKTKRILLNLFGHNWVDGVYDVGDIDPIFQEQIDFNRFVSGYTQVSVLVVSKAKSSTRVMLELV